MLKILILILFIFSSTNVYSKGSCQGARELAFKDSGDIYKQPQPDTQCCKGLKVMSGFAYESEKCEPLVGPFAYCMPCGDGVCDYSEYENICNCPQDCKVVRKNCSSVGELILKRPQKGMHSQIWLPNQCCNGLVEEYNDGTTAKCTNPKVYKYEKNISSLFIWQKCNQNSDCIIVKAPDPCHCEVLSIGKQYVKTFEDFKAFQSSDRLQEHEICSACKEKIHVPTCINNRCGISLKP